jgi:hypothetical protein
MKSSTSASFRKQLEALPSHVQAKARNQFRLWKDNRSHPSVHFKPVGAYWSARVDREIRALGFRKGDFIVWFYIGSHDGYEDHL